MKKSVALLLFVLLASPALAAQRGTPEYEALKAYKKTQHEKKEHEKAAPAAHVKGFWEREAERSGLAGTGAMVTNAVTCALPLNKPNSGKTAQ
jgi:hypothetical protein